MEQTIGTGSSEHLDLQPDIKDEDPFYLNEIIGHPSSFSFSSSSSMGIDDWGQDIMFSNLEENNSSSSRSNPESPLDKPSIISASTPAVSPKTSDLNTLYTSPKRSPSIQMMGRTAGYDPTMGIDDCEMDIAFSNLEENSSRSSRSYPESPLHKSSIISASTPTVSPITSDLDMLYASLRISSSSSSSSSSAGIDDFRTDITFSNLEENGSSLSRSNPESLLDKPIIISASTPAVSPKTSDLNTLYASPKQSSSSSSSMGIDDWGQDIMFSNLEENNSSSSRSNPESPLDKPSIISASTPAVSPKTSDLNTLYTSPKRSPSIQMMGRTAGYDPTMGIDDCEMDIAFSNLEENSSRSSRSYPESPLHKSSIISASTPTVSPITSDLDMLYASLRISSSSSSSSSSAGIDDFRTDITFSNLEENGSSLSRSNPESLLDKPTIISAPTPAVSPKTSDLNTLYASSKQSPSIQMMGLTAGDDPTTGIDDCRMDVTFSNLEENSSSSSRSYPESPLHKPSLTSASTPAVSPKTSDSNTLYASPKRSPSIQMMGRTPGYDPNRIPMSVFAPRQTNNSGWSLISNESLFSIRVGDDSFSADTGNFINNGEFNKLNDRLYFTSDANKSLLETVAENERKEVIHETQNTLPIISKMENERSPALKPSPDSTVPELKGTSPKSACTPRHSDASGQSVSSFAFAELGGASLTKVNAEKPRPPPSPSRIPEEVATEEPNTKDPSKTPEAGGNKWFDCFSCCLSCR